MAIEPAAQGGGEWWVGGGSRDSRTRCGYHSSNNRLLASDLEC